MRNQLFFLAGLVLPLSALASPLNRALIPADAAVTAHIDVEAFAGSQLGQEIIKNRDHFKLGGLDALKAFGIEPFRDFLGVTVFMPSVDAEEPVVVVRATEAIDALWKHLKTEPHAKPMSSEGYELLSWEDKGERKYGFVRAEGNSRLAFISDNWEPLITALKTVDGKSPAQKGGATPAAGSFFFADVRELPAKLLDRDDDGPTAVIREVRSAVIDAGESGENMFASADVELSSAKTASDVQQMAQGLVAFGRMALNEHKELSGLRQALDAFGAKTDGTHLLLSTKWSASDAVAAANKLAKEMSEDEDDDRDDDRRSKKREKAGD
ncbi:MAG: hypothetical protein KF691_01135 [Phycisphaeraceae bacterium]|nr:hypothetical protein [Phycisphaeraceae bacterium]